jgi:hypothetical protein
MHGGGSSRTVRTVLSRECSPYIHRAITGGLLLGISVRYPIIYHEADVVAQYLSLDHLGTSSAA